MRLVAVEWAMNLFNMRIILLCIHFMNIKSLLQCGKFPSFDLSVSRSLLVLCAHASLPFPIVARIRIRILVPDKNFRSVIMRQ